MPLPPVYPRLPACVAHAAALGLGGGATTAYASSETDLPPALRADVSVGYEARVGWAGLEEDGPENPVQVGRRRDIAHDLVGRLTFSPVTGVALTLGVDGLAHRRVVFPEAFRILEDPATGQGTYLGAPPLADPPRTVGSGLVGVWMGAAFQPFASHYPKAHPVTWRLDVAVRTAPPNLFWAPDAEGKRGAGDGGPTFRLAGAFSRDRGPASAYITAAWQVQTRREVEVQTPTGSASLQINPGQALDVRGGVEIRMSEPSPAKTEEGSVDLDLHTGFGYRTEQRVAPGILLPDVLPQALGVVAVTGERLGWHVGAAVDADFTKLVQFRIWTRTFWTLPWRVEHPYRVRTTLDSADAGFGLDLLVRIR